MAVKDGVSRPNESLVGDLECITIVTTAAIASDGAVGDADQELFNKFIEVISLQAQPIIISPVTGGNTFTCVFEHTGMWVESNSESVNSVSLKTELEAIAGAGTITITTDGSLCEIFNGVVVNLGKTTFNNDTMTFDGNTTMFDTVII